MLILASLWLGAVLGFCLHAILSAAHEQEMCATCRYAPKEWVA